jgi:hypothetical protein
MVSYAKAVLRCIQYTLLRLNHRYDHDIIVDNLCDKLMWNVGRVLCYRLSHG